MSKGVLGRFFWKRFFFPSVPWSNRNFSKKSKKIFKILKVPKIVPKVSKRVLNMLWGDFSDFFCPVFHGVIEYFQKNQEKFQNSKSAQNWSPKCPNVFWTCFGAIFPIFFAQCSMESSNIFKKIKKSFKIPKVHKIDPKSVQTCFEHALGRFFRFFLPSVPCRAFQVSWTEKYEFSFPDLNLRVQYSETILNRHSLCIHATVNIRNPISDFLDLKLLVQIPELKNMNSVFWTEKNWIQFSGLKIWGRYLEKTQEKKQKKFKVLKLSKIVLRCSNVFWGIFFEKKFSPVFHGRSSLRKIPKIQKCPKSFPKLSKLALNMFWGNFSEKKFRPVFHGWSSLRQFSEKLKKIKIQKMPLIVSKSVQTCFEHALRQYFRKNFCPVFPAGLFRFSGLKIMSSGSRI